MSRLDPYNASWARLYLKQMQTVAAHMIYLPVEPVDAKKKGERQRERKRDMLPLTSSIAILGFHLSCNACDYQLGGIKNKRLPAGNSLSKNNQSLSVSLNKWMVRVKFSDLSKMRLITTLLLLLVRKPRSWRHVRLCAHGEGPGCTLADKSPFKTTWTECMTWFLQVVRFDQVLQLKIFCRGIC